ncbi:tripartite tricarboxylate transporter substrate binding protein [Imbroritus primus]|uniref:tripartite tricarboxylate transporter substrate binding protein n=1 Tax=Imbroritus primus TaxID=3058603 RepID=UPI003D1616EC
MKTTLLRRSALLALFACLPHSAAQANEWPTQQPIKLIVPWAPGGVADFLGRLVGHSLTQELGQQVIVENKPGAGTNIGSDQVAKAKPDGYTLLMASSNNAVNMSLFPKMSYDTVKDFSPITLVGYTPMVLLAQPSRVSAGNLREFIDQARSKPGKLVYASAGNGSPSHLAAAAFEQSAKVKFTHVPYKGAAPAVNDLLGGHVDILFTNVPASIGHIQSGKLKAYAITGTKRTPALPNLPTFAEAGLPDYDATGWYGIVAPRNTPPQIVERLHKAIDKAMADPAFQAQAKKQGVELAPAMTPRAFSERIQKDIEQYRTLIRETGITAE